MASAVPSLILNGPTMSKPTRLIIIYLFRIISNKRIVFFGSKIAQFTLRFRLPIIGLFKHTIFKQFCGGLKKEDSIKLVNRLDKMGVKSYMHYAAAVSYTHLTLPTKA